MVEPAVEVTAGNIIIIIIIIIIIMCIYFTVEQATKGQRESRGVALLFP
jgi:uncharacterized protein YpmB